MVSYHREWREKQTSIIADKDERSESKRQETIGAAHESIDRFYEDYNQKKAKSITENRYRFLEGNAKGGEDDDEGEGEEKKRVSRAFSRWMFRGSRFS